MAKATVSRCSTPGSVFLGLDEVVSGPRRVNQNEAEWLRSAQIADFVLISRRHCTKTVGRHGSDALAFLALPTNLPVAGNGNEEVPRLCMDVWRKLLPRIHAEQARLRFRNLMQHSLRAIAVRANADG